MGSKSDDEWEDLAQDLSTDLPPSSKLKRTSLEGDLKVQADGDVGGTTSTSSS